MANIGTMILIAAMMIWEAMLIGIRIRTQGTLCVLLIEENSMIRKFSETSAVTKYDTIEPLAVNYDNVEQDDETDMFSSLSQFVLNDGTVLQDHLVPQDDDEMTELIQSLLSLGAPDIDAEPFAGLGNGKKKGPWKMLFGSFRRHRYLSCCFFLDFISFSCCGH